MRVPAQLAIGTATLALALGHALYDSWTAAWISLLLGLLWIVALRRGIAGVHNLALVGLIVLAVLGAWWQLPPAWMLCALVALLVAWDLDRFQRRLRDAANVYDQASLLRLHHRRLAAVAAAGLLLGAIALLLQFQLTFGWALLLGALALFGLIRAIGTS